MSKLGVIIINSLIEEVKTGISIMKSSQLPDTLLPHRLPKATWSGMTTISDEVILRIIETSNNISPTSFSPLEIRIHCKNYFDHMCLSWEIALEDEIFGRERIKDLISNAKYIEAAENVYKMLVQTKDLLEKNSKKIFPK